MERLREGMKKVNKRRSCQQEGHHPVHQEWQQCCHHQDPDPADSRKAQQSWQGEGVPAGAGVDHRQHRNDEHGNGVRVLGHRTPPAEKPRVQYSNNR